MTISQETICNRLRNKKGPSTSDGMSAATAAAMAAAAADDVIPQGIISWCWKRGKTIKNAPLFAQKQVSKTMTKAKEGGNEANKH